MLSLDNPRLMPPICCQEIIPLEYAMPFFDSGLKRSGTRSIRNPRLEIMYTVLGLAVVHGLNPQD